MTTTEEPLSVKDETGAPTQTKMILKQKLVSLKVCHEDRKKFRKNFVTIRLGNMNNVAVVVEEFCKMRDIKNPQEYRLVMFDHVLVMDKSLQENQIDTTSQLFPVTLVHVSEVEKNGLTEQRLIKRKERMVPAKIYVPPPSPPLATTSNNSNNNNNNNNTSNNTGSENNGAAAEDAKKKKGKSVEIKLRIQEKVNNQVVGCDITAKSGMKFEKIQTMYCAHRKYNVKDYVFASYGVLMEPSKSLNQLGLNQMGKVYTIQVYHKDRVNIADSSSTVPS
jgi:hypothetical protein